MPYIKQETRERLKFALELLESVMFFAESKLEEKCSSGTLNYIVTKVVKRFLGENPNYERYNAAIGALECAKLELYRRTIADYENGKIYINGDVW